MITKTVVTHIRIHDNVAEYPIPIILIGNQTDLRNDTETLNDLSKLEKQPITYEIGLQLACTIKAVKYLECSSCSGMEIKKMFNELIWTLLRFFKRIQQLIIQEKDKQKHGFFKRLFGWWLRKYMFTGSPIFLAKGENLTPRQVEIPK